jgi:bacteriorhodopsin
MPAVSSRRLRSQGLVEAIAERSRWSHACRQRVLRVGSQTEEVSMLWALVVILVVLWLAGFLVFQIGGALIHLILVIAAIVLIYQIVTGRRAL